MKQIMDAQSGACPITMQSDGFMILFENRDNPGRGKSKNSAKPMRAARKTVCEAGKQERASFLKKRSKKLLLNRDRAGETCCGPESQKFFGSFFQKRTSSFL